MIRSDIVLLRPLWFDNGFVQDESCNRSLKLWLTDGNYYIDNSQPNVSLFCQSVDEIKKSLSLDAFKFATHAAQTVYELENTGAYTQFTSWRLIQTYYAAFFSAHACMRFFGRSFSHLENGHVRFIKNRCETEAGFSPTLPSTYYLLSFSPVDQTLAFKQCGESHRDLWRSFSGLLTDISNNCLALRATEIRRQGLSQKFSELVDALSDRGKYPAGNWLSTMRNEVNYKSLHGLWFPFDKGVPAFEELMRPVRTWRQCTTRFEDPNTVSNDKERFFMTAFLVIDLALSVALDYLDLVGNSGQRSSEFRRLLNLSAAN